MRGLVCLVGSVGMLAEWSPKLPCGVESPWGVPLARGGVQIDSWESDPGEGAQGREPTGGTQWRETVLAKYVAN